MKKTNLTFIFILSVLYLSPNPVLSQYKQTVQRAPEKGEIPVSEPGSYDKIGATYILVNNITSPKSAIFLGKDVTLDLNGYTVSYAAGDYQHIP
ncbi:MAG: hypothetical protein KAI95_13925, partial [Bacteroidales bacterium]|nr:hypothetical protein [Bacteroidales bacterium]